MGKVMNDKERILALEVEGTAVWPIEKMTSIRSLASQCGMISGNIYETKTDREERTITVTRVR